MVTELLFGNRITITELYVFFSCTIYHKKLIMGPKYIIGQHRHWDNVSAKYEWNLWTILMKTVHGFRNMYHLKHVLYVTRDTTRNGIYL